jgi:hypothetical protein
MATEQQKEPESSIAYKSESMSVLRILCAFSARTYGALQARVQPWEFPDNALQNYFGIMIQDIEQSVSGEKCFRAFFIPPHPALFALLLGRRNCGRFLQRISGTELYIIW